MGIDVYLRWNGQTEEETRAQYTGYSVVHGHVGYLREAYHGEPYATKVLLPEAFESAEPVRIVAATLRDRLPAVVAAAKDRGRQIYGEDLTDDDPIIKSFIDFVALAEEKEALGLEPQVLVA